MADEIKKDVEVADSGAKTIDKSDIKKVWWRSQFLLASFNYERMQNMGVAFSLIPAMRKLYSTKEEISAFLKRHLEFFNTHPYCAAPIFGVEMALEENRANGGEVDDDPFSLADLERLNASLAEPLGCAAVWRTGDEPASGLPDVTLTPASHARHLLGSLFAWYGRTDLHPLVASSVFRLEYCYIQPFACASRLTGVLWHHLALARWNVVFRWCELEQVLLEHLVEWREAVAESRTRINDAPYVIFMLGALAEALRRLDGQLRGSLPTARASERLLAYFAERPQATISEAARALGVSPRTCARHVADLKQAGKLERVGSRRNGTWRVG